MVRWNSSVSLVNRAEMSLQAFRTPRVSTALAASLSDTFSIYRKEIVITFVAQLQTVLEIDLMMKGSPRQRNRDMHEQYKRRLTDSQSSELPAKDHHR